MIFELLLEEISTLRSHDTAHGCEKLGLFQENKGKLQLKQSKTLKIKGYTTNMSREMNESLDLVASSLSQMSTR